MWHRIWHSSIKNRLTFLFFSITAGAILVFYFYVVPQLESSLTQQKVDSLKQDSSAYSRSLHNAIGREVTVLWKVHPAGDIHPDAGVERRHGVAVEHLRIDTQSAAHFRRPGFLVQRMAGPAQHQQALLHEPEIASRKRRQLVVAAVARLAQVAKKRGGASPLARIGSPRPEGPATAAASRRTATPDSTST